jgi:hypothetical protein
MIVFGRSTAFRLAVRWLRVKEQHSRLRRKHEEKIDTAATGKQSHPEAASFASIHPANQIPST